MKSLVIIKSLLMSILNSCIAAACVWVACDINTYTVNDLLNAQGVYLIFVLKGGHLIDMRHLLEGGIYFLSKVTHSNRYHNKLTALLNSNNFHTTFAERTLLNKLLIDEVVYMLFILGKTLSVMEKKILGFM